MIKELNELVWYAHKSVWRDEELLDFLCRSKPEVMAIYRGVREQHFRTDEEAARALNMGLTAFKKHGKALQGHLNEAVFFFNDEKARADITLKNIFSGAKELAAVRMLNWRACRLSSRETAQRLLRRGLQYDWPEFVVDAALFLRESVVRVGGTAREFEAYSDLYHEYSSHLEWERRSWEYYLRTKLPSRKQAVVSKRLAEQIAGYLSELAPQVDRIPSYFFHLYYFTLLNHYSIQMADHDGLIRNCEAAIAHFEGRSYPVVNPLSIFYYSKVVAHIMLGQFEQGRKAVEQSLLLLDEGSSNWFNAMEVYVYLALHEGDYPKALELYARVANHRRLGSLYPSRQENWQILGAYCYILHRLLPIALPAGFPQFRSRKFLNNLPVYSRDKNGMNLAILIAHVILQLVEGRADEVWERILALEKYRARHLRKEKPAQRVELFIRLLALVSKSGTDVRRFQTKAEPLVRQLRAVPMQFTAQAHELEVIPYETLAGLIGTFLARSGSAMHKSNFS